MSDAQKNNFRKFLDGQMSDEEVQSFKEQLKKDDQLLEELSEEIVKSHGRIELKKLLSEIEQKVEIKNKRNLPSWMKIAASIILLAGCFMLMKIIFLKKNEKEEHLISEQPKQIPENEKIALDTLNYDINSNRVEEQTPNIIFPPNKDIDNKEVMAELPSEIVQEDRSLKHLALDNFESYPRPVYRSEENSFFDIFEHYKQKNYDSVISLINILIPKLSSEEDINTALYFRGICLLNNGMKDMNMRQLTNAKKSFQALYADKQAKYSEESAWYLAILYLYEENENQAIALLKIIKDKKLYNYKKALKLLEILWSGSQQ